MPGVALEPSPIWNSCLAGPKSAWIGKNATSLSARRFTRRLDEEVEQARRVAPARRAMRKPPPPGEANTASATKVMKAPASRGIEGVAAVLQDFRCGGCGQFMPRRDDALSLAHALG